jgi:hypothetical protein
LFSLIFSAILTDVFTEDNPGLDIRYRTYGKLFNPRRLKSQINVSHTWIRDLLFADDCALNAASEEQAQPIMDNFSAVCDYFGLTISTKNTEVLFQQSPGRVCSEPIIKVKVDTFTYLESMLSRRVHIDAEIDSRIAKASTAFGRLRTEKRGIKVTTKKRLSLPSSCIPSRRALSTVDMLADSGNSTFTLHVCAECWASSSSKRFPTVGTTYILERAYLPSIHMLLQRCHLPYGGHLQRMPDNIIPKQLFYGELKTGSYDFVSSTL